LSFQRRIVPDVDEETTDADAMVETAKYIAALRLTASDDDIASFIAQNLRD
jgi:hypothetical protein